MADDAQKPSQSSEKLNTAIGCSVIAAVIGAVIYFASPWLSTIAEKWERAVQNEQDKADAEGLAAAHGGRSEQKIEKPRAVEGLTSKWDAGRFSHDWVLTNESPGGDLRDVSVTIAFWREDGTKLEVQRYWSKWAVGETKKINVPRHEYQKQELKGKAEQGTSEMNIDDVWTSTWRPASP